MPEPEFLSWKCPAQASATLALLWFFQVTLVCPAQALQGLLPSTLTNANSLILQIPTSEAFPEYSQASCYTLGFFHSLNCKQFIFAKLTVLCPMSSLDHELQEGRDCLSRIHTGLSSTFTGSNMQRHKTNILVSPGNLCGFSEKRKGKEHTF